MVQALDLVVLGLGYVGLPVAQAATAAGLAVVGFDPDRDKVHGLEAGRSHIDDLSDDDVAAMLAAGFRATADPACLADAAAAVICVPTPLSDNGAPGPGRRWSLHPDRSQLPVVSGEAARLARRLLELGADLSYHDPYVATWQVDGRELACADLDEAAAAADLVIVLQHHRQYTARDLAGKAQLLLDTRGVLHGERVHRL